MKRSVFFTSDWHLHHTQVIKFSNRPFKDIHHMHRVLINNYNSTVPPHGLCYFLGDVGFPDKEIISQLNGKKIVLMGNHDKGTYSLQQIFDGVLYTGSLVIAKEIVTMSHCPLARIKREDTSHFKNGNPDEYWHGELRPKFAPFIVPNFGQFHLHGHTHAPNGGKSEVKFGRQWDIGVDGNNYTPVSISPVESWITKKLEYEKRNFKK